MDNPWKDIKLSDYENHMRLDSVMQLQAMNQMMKIQFNSYDVKSAVILGVAGGNGLEHIDTSKYSVVYGVDINNNYLIETEKRYHELKPTLKCLCIDLITDTEKLPCADLVIANLLIEYIGYDCFKKAVIKINPKYVSCIIQINTDDSFVSDSPYLHSFDKLEQVHHQMEVNKLVSAMNDICYKQISIYEKDLPNGKKLVQLDFKNSGESNDF